MSVQYSWEDDVGTNERSATDLCQQMTKLLVRMRTYATPEDNFEIGTTLEAVNDFYSLAPEKINLETSISVELEESLSEASLVVHNIGASHYVPHDTFNTSHRYTACSSDRVASLDEDLHASDSARAIGYIGMSSEVRWLQSIAATRSQQVGNGVEPSAQSYESQSIETQASSLSYWTDGTDVRPTETDIDPHELPPIGLAKKLLSCYLLKVHDSFPILPRATFESQFRMYFTALQHGNPPRLTPKWQANLNLVFAIGAKYSLLADDGQHVDRCDHSVFQARANALSSDEIEQTESVNVPQIQYFLLLAFYHLCIGQVSR